MQESKFVKEICSAVKLNDIDIYELHYCKNNYYWTEVEELLKDNNLWNEYYYRKHLNVNYDSDYEEPDVYFDSKRIYLIQSKYENENEVNLSSRENNLVIYSPENAIHKYIYRPDYSDKYYSEHKGYSVILPIDEPYYGFLIILLANDNVIVGRYGITEFGYQIDKCHYYKDVKQVPFDKLDEPFKNLVIEKLIKEKQQGLDMNNLLHLLPK